MQTSLPCHDCTERPELVILLQKMGESESRVDELFTEADADGDGKVSFQVSEECTSITESPLP